MAKIIISILLFVSINSCAQFPLFHAHNVILASPKLLDLYPNSEVALSLRKIRNNYTGSVIKVRRDSDSTFMNILFLNDILDTATLKTFVGSGSGYISEWYDQSIGTYRSAIQTDTSLQPIIIRNGIIYREGLFPAIRFENGKYLRFEGIAADTSTRISTFVAAKLTSNYSGYSRLLSFNPDQIMYIGTNSSNQVATFYGNGLSWGLVSAQSSNSWLNNWLLVTTINNGNDNQYINNVFISSRSNSVQYNKSAKSTANLFIGGYFNNMGQEWYGTLSEVVMYFKDRSSERAGIENNINSFYLIY